MAGKPGERGLRVSTFVICYLMLRIIVLFQLHPNSGVLIIQGLPGQLGQPGSKGDTGDPGEDGRNVRHIL